MLPKIIGYFFIKRFNTQIEFGRVSLPFTLRAVKIVKNGFSIVCICIIDFFFGRNMTDISDSKYMDENYSKSTKSPFEAVSLTPKLANCFRLQYVIFASTRTSTRLSSPMQMEVAPVKMIHPIRI